MDLLKIYLLGIVMTHMVFCQLCENQLDDAYKLKEKDCADYSNDTHVCCAIFNDNVSACNPFEHGYSKEEDIEINNTTYKVTCLKPLRCGILNPTGTNDCKPYSEPNNTCCYAEDFNNRNLCVYLGDDISDHAPHVEFETSQGIYLHCGFSYEFSLMLVFLLIVNIINF